MPPSASPQQRPCPHFGRAWSRLSLALAGAALAGAGSAHDLFTAYIQHRVAVTIGAKHTDVTVQLTFFEDSSEHERGHMDADGNRRISRAEREGYLTNKEAGLNRAVTLRVDGQAVALTPLRAAELDLLGNDGVGRGHHQLTLHCFATTPPALSNGTELTVEDRLWPEIRALGAISAEGLDGCQAETVALKDPAFPPARADEAREFKVRVLAPPRSPAAQTVPKSSP
jgi:hypothetical protein